MRVVRVKSKAMQIYALFSRFCSLFPIRLGRHLDSLDREETGIECSRECSFFHGKSATALRHLTKVLVCDPIHPPGVLYTLCDTSKAHFSSRNIKPVAET